MSGIKGVRGSGRPTRFGPQPLVQVINERGLSVRRVADQLLIDSSYIYRVSCGRVAPDEELRRRLSGFLQLPEEQLFTAGALAHTRNQDRGDGYEPFLDRRANA